MTHYMSHLLINKHIMELLTIEAFFQLIINIIAFWIMLKIWTKISKKEHEDQLAKERIEWESERSELIKHEWEYLKLLLENKELRKSNKALKGWNTKYVKTIDNLEIVIEDQKATIELQSECIIDIDSEKKLCKINEDKVRWELIETNKIIDESKPMCEKLLTMVKKKDMEEAKAIVKEYYKM